VESDAVAVIVETGPETVANLHSIANAPCVDFSSLIHGPRNGMKLYCFRVVDEALDAHDPLSCVCVGLYEKAFDPGYDFDLLSEELFGCECPLGSGRLSVLRAMVQKLESVELPGCCDL
jgi:hypothetical protein